MLPTSVIFGGMPQRLAVSAHWAVAGTHLSRLNIVMSAPISNLVVISCRKDSSSPPARHKCPIDSFSLLSHGASYNSTNGSTVHLPLTVSAGCLCFFGDRRVGVGVRGVGDGGGGG
jgi:hypothetical protein